MMVEDGIIHCIDLPGYNPVSWNDEYCSYGVLKEDVTKTDKKIAYLCTDTVSESTTEEKDVRETKTNPTDNEQYSWSYVISSAKLFDKAFTNENTLEPYYEYSLNNYNDFIQKKNSYKDMTVEAFKESEESNSKADMFKHEEKDYNITENNNELYPCNSEWCEDKYVVQSIPAGATFISEHWNGVIKKDTVINKVGKEYTDTYNWFDELKPGESKVGIYNMDSVNDVTGEDDTPLDSNESSYYNKIYMGQELNLIDLMNSDSVLYQNYISKKDASSDNIGIRRGALDISYNVLREDLKDQLETYNTVGLIYGNSLGISPNGTSILSSLDLSSIVAAGDVNQLVLAIAESCMGYHLSDFRSASFEDYDCFPWSTHWCAMFASYCVKRASVELGMSECPVPWFPSCSNFWSAHIKNGTNVGFYDVDTGATSAKTSVSSAIAPLEAIQPGDILLFTWPGDPVRSHAAIAKSVEKDANGKVTKIVSINGNWGGGGYTTSTVKECSHTWTGPTSRVTLSSITSFVSVSTVFAQALGGGITP